MAEDPHEESLTLAERQMANARRDPRRDRPPAVIADFWIALEAAERTRTVAILGISCLAQRSGEEMWERVQLAQAELENEFAEFNGQALVAILSALDSLVESLVPRAREMLGTAIIEHSFETALDQVPEAGGTPNFDEVLAKLRETVTELLPSVLDERLGKVRRARGVGVKRWEEVLRATALDAPGDREIPADLDQALEEAVSLRHVLVHRAGRADSKALEDAPSLPYEDGQLVRIMREDYLRYLAAVRSYGEEVVWRFARGIGLDPPDLVSWRKNYPLGT